MRSCGHYESGWRRAGGHAGGPRDPPVRGDCGAGVAAAQKLVATAAVADLAAAAGGGRRPGGRRVPARMAGGPRRPRALGRGEADFSCFLKHKLHQALLVYI